MKMDSYMKGLCKTLKYDVTRSKYKLVIDKSEKIIERETGNFGMFSSNVLIHFLYLESYCCHKSILKILMNDIERVNKWEVKQILQIMVRNLVIIHGLIKQHLDNMQIIVNFGHNKKAYHQMHKRGQLSHISDQSFSNFIQISTWLTKDLIIVLNLNHRSKSKQEIFESTVNFFTLITTTVRKKKIIFRVNELEVRCLYIVFQFRNKDYKAGSSFCQRTITQIYQLLFHLTHKKQKVRAQKVHNYNKGIKKCYKLLFIVLIYQAFFHICTDNFHPLQALLSIIKKIEIIPGPKELIKYYQSYIQIINQIVNIIRAHEQLSLNFGNGQIFSANAIFNIIQNGEKPKQKQNLKAYTRVSTTGSKILKRSQIVRIPSMFDAKSSKRQETLGREKSSPTDFTLQGAREIKSIVNLQLMRDDNQRIFETQRQKISTQSIFKRKRKIQTGKEVVFQDQTQNKVEQQPALIQKMISKQIIKLSSMVNEDTIKERKIQLMKKKNVKKSAYQIELIQELDSDALAPTNPFLKNQQKWVKVKTNDQQQSCENISTELEIKKNVKSYQRNRAIKTTKENLKKEGLKNQLYLVSQILIGQEKRQRKAMTSKFISILIKNKSALSIYSYASKYEANCKRQENKRIKKLEEEKMNSNYGTGEQNNFMFYASVPNWKSSEPEEKNNKLKLNKMKSQNFERKQPLFRFTGQINAVKKAKHQIHIQIMEQTQRNQDDHKKEMQNCRLNSKNRQKVRFKTTSSTHRYVNKYEQIQKSVKGVQIEDKSYDQRLRVCFEKSRRSIQEVTSKIIRKQEAQVLKSKKSKILRKSQAFFVY